MSDIVIRQTAHAGRITLARPEALNAMTYEMCLQIEAALDRWARDERIALVVLDAEGDKAFCAGGDIAQLYETGMAGDYAFGQRFWADEYRLNAKIFNYPKPVISFLQGFTMGGGVGLGCHGTHRIVGESSRIAMPECGIGLIPDVGGTLILALAPGRVGEYLGTTGYRMGPADALFAGFADHFIPQDAWPGLIAQLEDGASVDIIKHAAQDPDASALADLQPEIERHFAGEGLSDILTTLQTDDSDFAKDTLKLLHRNSPLAMACTVEVLHRLRGPTLSMAKALDHEYRFTYRAMQHGDLLEGIRAAIIDKDRTPKWQYADMRVPAIAVSKMLMPLGKNALTLEDVAMTKTNVGFIGLGNMGAPMAANLAKAGLHVIGYDTAGTTAEGVTQAQSAIEAAQGADIVLSMLPNGAILRDVASTVLPVMKPGALFLDCSTVDVDSARAVAQAARDASVQFVDAPVSGGVGGAAAGTLTFMAGGSAEAFETARPLFDIMGQKAVHCGAPGAGQAAKICNNMILGATMIATCEAFALADKLGLDRQKMFDVVSTSSGYSWSMNAYCPAPGVGPQSPADNDYTPGFAAELMLKDLGLSQQAAEAVDADTPMGARALALYRAFVEEEDGRGKDFSAMLPRFTQRSRTE
ncbi:3-hydroxyisobutyrate dehydrogenase [Roseobacter denitrificans]|uniref:3-hydroxyisobutyrate dehydrogenase n=1 Tax=Roseobacter denitrificans (strain ATCC 33942 / OCh 114) TaxID=375451 RepID=Q164T3_ROSDO|nr:3-hydroxyisobutyrate dehydrogenase [Roseobacter denitrificans]ABG32510.1 3-hydroxyisobutyrate dehydrogenase [Roseobacter denitrificans OCh 114]AVL54775.1 3-hydroxyisobutyrate dehydrogenase [Roseobacter denitrificans]SFF82823.1 3-hydroxyisobutyrate dehydrogenase [Roseobacter denitrificans OCh 114]